MAKTLQLLDRYSAQSQYEMILDVRVKSQLQATNENELQWYLRTKKYSGSGYWWLSAAGKMKVTIGGKTVLDKIVPASDFRNATPKTITWASGTVKVPANDDGTAKIAISATVNGIVIGTATKSGTLTPDRINRGPRVRVSGTYKPTIAYVRTGGVWKVAIPYVRVNGSWKIAGS